MNLHIHNGKRLAQPDFPKKFRIIQKSRKRARNGPFLTLVRFWRKTGLRNFPKARYYDRAAFFWEPRENRMSGKILIDFWEFFFVRRVGRFEWSIQLLAIFFRLVDRINLILHIVIVLNVFDHFATLPSHAGSFKNQNKAFLNDPKSQKRGFWSFFVVWSVGPTSVGLVVVGLIDIFWKKL